MQSDLFGAMRDALSVTNDRSPDSPLEDCDTRPGATAAISLGQSPRWQQLGGWIARARAD